MEDEADCVASGGRGGSVQVTGRVTAINVLLKAGARKEGRPRMRRLAGPYRNGVVSPVSIPSWW